jgi:hypothetical protein
VRLTHLPTAEQGIRCVVLCQSLTNTFVPIFMVRLDERTGRLFLLAGDTIRNRDLSQRLLETFISFYGEVLLGIVFGAVGSISSFVLRIPDGES